MPEAGLVALAVVETSMYSNRIVRSCDRVSCYQGPQMWPISFLIVAQVDSIAALSKQSPTVP